MTDDVEKVIQQMIPKQHEMYRIEGIILLIKIIKHLEFYYHYDFTDKDLKDLIKKYDDIAYVRRKR